MTLHCFINHFIVVIILRLHCTKSDFRWDWDPYPGEDQCRRNDFEIGGGACPVQSTVKNLSRGPPLLWLYKYNMSFRWSLSWWSVQFGQFLVCSSSTLGAPRAQPFVKVRARAPVPFGVSATVLSVICITLFFTGHQELTHSPYYIYGVHWRWWTELNVKTS